MKKLVLMCGILASGIVFMLSEQASDADRFDEFDEFLRQMEEKDKQEGILLSEFIRQELEQEGRKIGAMSSDEWARDANECLRVRDRNACEALINNGLPSVEQCKGFGCFLAGNIYNFAERYGKAIPYYEKAIETGDIGSYGILTGFYYELQNHYEAEMYYRLGIMYENGQGVRQDYAKVVELWKKACDMKDEFACGGLAALYFSGRGVRQNLSIAKQYYGKVCDLGKQWGCDEYKELNELGVK